jgi:cytochrome b
MQAPDGLLKHHSAQLTHSQFSVLNVLIVVHITGVAMIPELNSLMDGM